MKKVGLAIVTYGTNYGTYLQAFATQYTIRKQGFDTEIINIDSVANEVGSARKKYFIKQIFNIPELKSYSHVIYGLISEKTNGNYRKYINNRKEQFAKFKKENFLFSEIKNSWNGLKEHCNENYDYVLVGSDQLWRPANIAGDFYTLNFVPDNITKIAYATSFGLKEIRKNQTNISKKFLSRIQHLSVREKSGAKIVKDLISRDIPVVCDPTMLLSKDDWNEFVSSEPIIKDKYILCYFLGDNKEHRNFAKKLADKTGCKIVSLLHIAGYISSDKDFGDITPNDIGPFEFLNLTKNADYVCTDSFHGCVFTTIFEKNLFAFRRFSKNNKMSTNDRITTLLTTLGMEDRLIYGTENAESFINKNTNYDYVKTNLELKRADSLQYLSDAFEDKPTDL